MLPVNLFHRWDISAIFQLELLPFPKAAGRPRWILWDSFERSSWERERKFLGAGYVPFVHGHIAIIPNIPAPLMRFFVEAIAEADDEVLRATNVYRGPSEAITFARLNDLVQGFQTQVWLDAINQETRGYFDVVANDTILVANVRFLKAIHRLLVDLNNRRPGLLPLYVTWHVVRALAWMVSPGVGMARFPDKQRLQDTCFEKVSYRISQGPPWSYTYSRN